VTGSTGFASRARYHLCFHSQFTKQDQEVAANMMSRDPVALFPDALSPDCFQPQALPPEPRMAERGDARSPQNGTAYELSGGSQVGLYRCRTSIQSMAW